MTNKFSKTVRQGKHLLAARVAKPNFELSGKKYRYFFHAYNDTAQNERIVEVPIFAEILKRHAGKRILEIGNVMAYYGDHDHDVVDKYEQSPGVVNQDVVAYQADPYDLIISISTLEHVGWDEDKREPDKIPQAIAHLRSLLAPGGRLIVSLPKGYNEDLDRHLAADTLPAAKFSYLKRTSPINKWQQVEWADIKDLTYNEPFPHANGIVIAEFSPA